MGVLACIVEGHGEMTAVPLLIRRVAEADGYGAVTVLPPYRTKRNQVTSPGQLEKIVEYLWTRTPKPEAILVLLDADNDCPVELSASFHDRVRTTSRPEKVGIVFAVREYEAWIIASLTSLQGKAGVVADAQSPAHPEEIRGAKEFLKDKMSNGSYRPTVDQARLTAQFNFGEAMATRSFRKLRKEVSRLLGQPATDV